jgi:predicted HTH domain antitoxin
MGTIQYVPKTELARNTHRVIREVQRGYTVLVENHGQAEAALLDIVDYRIVRAVMVYHNRSPEVSPEGLNTERLEGLDDSQKVYDLVLAHYLAGAISMGRAAELLDLPVLDLRFRFQRLDVPMNLGADNDQVAMDEVNAARGF